MTYAKRQKTDDLRLVLPTSKGGLELLVIGKSPKHRPYLGAYGLVDGMYRGSADSSVRLLRWLEAATRRVRADIKHNAAKAAAAKARRRTRSKP